MVTNGGDRELSSSWGVLVLMGGVVVLAARRGRDSSWLRIPWAHLVVATRVTTSFRAREGWWSVPCSRVIMLAVLRDRACRAGRRYRAPRYGRRERC